MSVEVSKHVFFLLKTDVTELQAAVDLGVFSFTVAPKLCVPRKNCTLDSEF